MEIENNILLPEVKKLLDEGYQVELAPKGVSMRPYIEGGRDSVILQNKDQHVSVGDIVLADIGGKYVLHRVIARSNDDLTLQGDGNLRGQEHCKRQDVLGVVTAILRSGHKEITPSSAYMWRHAPFIVRKYVLKIYRKTLKIK